LYNLDHSTVLRSARAASFAAMILTMPVDAFALAARWRIAVSRCAAVLIVAVLLVTGHSWSYHGAFDLGCSAVGFILVTACTLGRLWSLAFISGRKDVVLVQDGPYSCTRNPLYLFSAIGAVGLGIASRDPAVLVLIVAFFAFYYPAVILHEERQLGLRHGAVFAAYVRRVPRFVPRWSLYHEPETCAFQVRAYRRTFLDAMWFLWGFLALEVVERLKEAEVLCVLVQLP
jgi:protein-S-isoprenylcysteine O-methyltransferase Ste14